MPQPRIGFSIPRTAARSLTGIPCLAAVCLLLAWPAPAAGTDVGGTGTETSLRDTIDLAPAHAEASAPLPLL